MTLITGHPEFKDGIVTVEGTLKHENHSLVYAFVDPKTKEVIAFIKGLNKNGVVSFKAYDSKGEIKASQSFTFDELKQYQEEQSDKMKEYIDNYENNSGISPMAYDWDAFWISVVCDFSGAVSCALGCASFIFLGPEAPGICAGICAWAWGNGICSQA